MTSFAVALGALNLTGVRLLCTIGGCAGLIVVLFGLRLNRKARNKSQEPRSAPAETHPISQEPVNQPPASDQQIIRLTTYPAATRSSEMSQQQKIAAALDRAGIATPASWANSVPLSEPTTEQQTPAIALDQAPAQTPSSILRKMFLLGGSMLALISLIVFLTIR